MIAYLGPNGTFGHEAAELYFGVDRVASEAFICATNLSVIEAVVGGQASFGVVPIMNSTKGPILSVVEGLRGLDLSRRPYIVGSLELPVSQHLIGLSGASIFQIEEIRTHPEAYAQCQKYLRNYLPEVRFEAATSTAAAALEVKSAGLTTVVAIASRRAAELSGLAVIAGNINDNPDNRTRFLILSNEVTNMAASEKLWRDWVLLVSNK